MKEIVKKWKKDNILTEDLGFSVYNFILAKCSVKALELESEVGLPLHIRLPKIIPKKDKK